MCLILFLNFLRFLTPENSHSVPKTLDVFFIPCIDLRNSDNEKSCKMLRNKNNSDIFSNDTSVDCISNINCVWTSVVEVSIPSPVATECKHEISSEVTEPEGFNRFNIKAHHCHTTNSLFISIHTVTACFSKIHFNLPITPFLQVVVSTNISQYSSTQMLCFLSYRCRTDWFSGINSGRQPGRISTNLPPILTQVLCFGYIQ